MIDEKPKTIRELIGQTSYDLYHYKHPDVSEIQERLHELLMAGQLGGIKDDKLENISISNYNEMVEIKTSYSVRSCEQDAYFEFPTFIIDADDPISAMKEWAKRERIKEAESEVRLAEKSLESAKQDLEKARNN